MEYSAMKKAICSAAMLAATALPSLFIFPQIAKAQGGAGPMNNSTTMMDGSQAQQDMTEKYLTEQLGDSKEQSAYQAFHKVSEQDASKKIRLGLAFLSKYPTDRYSQAVYEELSETYYDTHDLPDFYAYSEKGISRFPDDVHLLALSGWVIPRAFDPREPDADKRLDTAEVYEKHALEVLDKIKKPDGLPDEKFAEFKTGEMAIAHSGLGLVYFRREQYDASEKELEIAAKNETTPDPTDLFVLGADLDNLGRYKEAEDAFNRCAAATSSVQDNCKKYAADAVQRAADAK
jgi:tetratricopeptide (TPR) repeat protein